MLVAPAGAGKTLGVAGWLQHRAPEPTHWVDGHQQSGPALDRLLEEAGNREGPPALVVVDDAHLLPATAVRVLDARLGAAPDRLRVVLLTRWDLALSKLVPQLLGHLTVIRGDALRLTDAETGELVRVHLPDADAALVDAIRTKAQGWCAAVVLAPGPARRRRAAPTSYAGSGRPAPVSRTSSPARSSLGWRPLERHLLLCCAAEPVLTAALANRLTGDPGAGDVLATLEQTGLLVNRVVGGSADDDADPSGARYTIHPLLREVARRRRVAGGVDAERARESVLRETRLDLAQGDIAGRVPAADGPRRARRGGAGGRRPRPVDDVPGTRRRTRRAGPRRRCDGRGAARRVAHDRVERLGPRRARAGRALGPAGGSAGTGRRGATSRPRPWHCDGPGTPGSGRTTPWPTGVQCLDRVRAARRPRPVARRAAPRDGRRRELAGPARRRRGAPRRGDRRRPVPPGSTAWSPRRRATWPSPTTWSVATPRASTWRSRSSPPTQGTPWRPPTPWPGRPIARELVELGALPFGDVPETTVATPDDPTARFWRRVADAGRALQAGSLERGRTRARPPRPRHAPTGAPVRRPPGRASRRRRRRGRPPVAPDRGVRPRGGWTLRGELAWVQGALADLDGDVRQAALLYDVASGHAAERHDIQARSCRPRLLRPGARLAGRPGRSATPPGRGARADAAGQVRVGLPGVEHPRDARRRADEPSRAWTGDGLDR